MEKRKGYKSTEFWLNAVGLITGLILGSGAVGENQWTQLIGGIVAAVCGASYTMGRSMVKSREALGSAHVEGELVKKHKS
ncbi:MAG: hypothetical protein CL524_01050 [Aequorivita sp.]|nr:hypothetical protein [Aequorivita sp.]